MKKLIIYFFLVSFSLYSQSYLKQIPSINKYNQSGSFKKKLLPPNNDYKFAIEITGNLLYNTGKVNPNSTSIKYDITKNITGGGGIFFHIKTSKETSIKFGAILDQNSFKFVGPGLDKNTLDAIDTVETKNDYSTSKANFNAVFNYNISDFSIEVGGIFAAKLSDVLNIIKTTNENTGQESKVEQTDIDKTNLGGHIGIRYNFKNGITIGLAYDILTSEGKTDFTESINNSKVVLGAGYIFKFGK